MIQDELLITTESKRGLEWKVVNMTFYWQTKSFKVGYVTPISPTWASGGMDAYTRLIDSTNVKLKARTR